MLLDELAAYIESNGLGTRATDLFEGFLPDDPDLVTVLFETPGAPPSLIDGRETRSVQVQTRAAGYGDARARAEAVYALLHGLHDVTLSGARYLLIRAKQPPFSLGRDDRQRTEMAFNIAATRDSPER